MLPAYININYIRGLLGRYKILREKWRVQLEYIQAQFLALGTGKTVGQPNVMYNRQLDIQIRISEKRTLFRFIFR